MNPLGVLTARDVMAAGPSSSGHAIDAETPVRTVMGLLRDGATELAVTEAGSAIGTIRSADVMAKLINQRGTV